MMWGASKDIFRGAMLAVLMSAISIATASQPEACVWMVRVSAAIGGASGLVAFLWRTMFPDYWIGKLL